MAQASDRTIEAACAGQQTAGQQTAGQQTAQAAPARARAALLGEADFWRLWYVGLAVFIARWLETIAVGVFAYQQTQSPFIVAMLTMLRLLPMGLFGAFLGAFAERMQRRTALILVVVMMLATSVVLTVLAHAGMLAVWHLAVASFLNGLGWATDNPVRRVMLGEVVGIDRMGTAMSLDVGANNASRMVGPTVSGLLYAGVGVQGVFACGIVLYATALVAAAGLRYRNRTAHAAGTAVMEQIAEGLRLVRGERRLIGTLVVTVIYNLFGWPFTSMVPVIGRDNLHLGPEGIGILASMDGVGAFFGALLIAVFARPAHYKRLYVGGAASYCALLVVFAVAPSPLIAGAALLLTGLGGAGFSIMQATLVYMAAPAEMRSRVLGVLSVCIGLGPLGFLLLGTLANRFGAEPATATIGIAGLLALALTWRWWRWIGA
ncbi:MAG: MFS transporter [Proteobacteria bacterium]|nr:MFS transporter [Pseudomonadota bacterium]